MTSHPVEVACDESGSEGEKLVGGCTDVFCHASVAMTVDEAEDCVGELREMIRSPAVEYKANLLLRQKNRHALEWFLGRDGPVHGRANAFLVDKTYLLLLAFATRLLRTQAFAADPAVTGLGVRDVASALYRASRTSAVPRSWTAFLVLLNDLMRWGPVGENASTDELVELAEAIRPAEPPGVAHDVLGLLGGHRRHLDALRTSTQPDPALPFAMDQLTPAILRAVDRWGAGGAPVSVVHDQQKTLTENRIARIAALRDASGAGGRLWAMRLAGPRTDLRIQVADFLAGVARKIVSDELAGTADPALTALLRDHVDPLSVWCDEESWSRVRPVT